MRKGTMREEIRSRLALSDAELAEFCQRWQVVELYLFGSALRDDFGPDSDLDLLVRYAPEAGLSLLGQVRMEQELSERLGRKVDLCSKKGIERSQNWIRRRNILESAELVYES